MDQLVCACLLRLAMHVRTYRAVEKYPLDLKDSLAACCTTRGGKIPADNGKCIKDISPAFEAIMNAEKEEDVPKKTEHAAKALGYLMHHTVQRLDGATLSGMAEMEYTIISGVCQDHTDCDHKKVFDGIDEDPEHGFDDEL